MHTECYHNQCTDHKSFAKRNILHQFKSLKAVFTESPYLRLCAKKYGYAYKEYAYAYKILKPLLPNVRIYAYAYKKRISVYTNMRIYAG